MLGKLYCQANPNLQQLLSLATVIYFSSLHHVITYASGNKNSNNIQCAERMPYLCICITHCLLWLMRREGGERPDLLTENNLLLCWRSESISNTPLQIQWSVKFDVKFAFSVLCIMKTFVNEVLWIILTMHSLLTVIIFIIFNVYWWWESLFIYNRLGTGSRLNS